MLDILLAGGRVCDGSGNPWRREDVGIRSGRIVATGAVREKARRRISASGLIVCPGFIDVHTHSDGIVKHPAAENFIRQGVTTVVSGNCGGSAFPIGEWLDKVEACRPAINYATLAGHGTIRTRVMGTANRKPTGSELVRMRRLFDRAMREGAIGMSTGLFYVPGAYARVGELIEVAKVVAARGGIYASHKRSAGGKMFEALSEAAAIGRKAGIRIEVSHMKVLHKKGRTRKNRVDEALGAISRFREQGLDYTCDVHPYPATYTSLSAVTIPSWVSKDGKLKERLKDERVRRKIRSRVAGKIGWIGGGDRITIAAFPPDRSLEGKSLADAAGKRKRDVVSTAMDMIVEGSPSCIFHALRPEDVGRIVCSPLVMIASDGGVIPAKKGVVHPRNYGTFPRVIREYVREKLLTLEEAIRKMTSMPARKFGISGRGVIAEGMTADIVVFDPKRIADRATFEKPHVFPSGIRHVIVNGSVAWDGRHVSRKRMGEVIRG